MTALQNKEHIMQSCAMLVIMQDGTTTYPPTQNPLCAVRFENGAGTNRQFSANCSQPLLGRYVSIQRAVGNTSTTMYLCEVQVIGKPPPESFGLYPGLTYPPPSPVVSGSGLHHS